MLNDENEAVSVDEKITAQRHLCEEKGYPYFAPRDGFCYRCGRQIYDVITLEEAGKYLITGCPFCRRSYCD